MDVLSRRINTLTLVSDWTFNASVNADLNCTSTIMMVRKDTDDKTTQHTIGIIISIIFFLPEKKYRRR